MHIVPEFIPKVYLIHRDRRRWEFKNIEEAANTLWQWNLIGRYREAPLIGSNFTETREYDYTDEVHYNVVTYDYIVRDEIGETITPTELKDVRTKDRESKWRSRRDATVEVAKNHFRTIPIPYTGKRGWRSHYRHVRTTAEIRENEFLKYDEDSIEYDVKPRARRTQNVPTVWDDIIRNDYRDHNWKRHRKTQWKEKS